MGHRITFCHNANGKKARQEGVIIYQVNEGMKFSYKKEDTYRMTLRDPRLMHVKYIYMAKESFQLFL